MYIYKYMNRIIDRCYDIDYKSIKNKQLLKN